MLPRRTSGADTGRQPGDDGGDGHTLEKTTTLGVAACICCPRGDPARPLDDTVVSGGYARPLRIRKAKTRNAWGAPVSVPP